MAYIVHRSLGEISRKQNWIPKNRKYKWFFFAHLLFDLIFILIVKYLKQY